MPTADDFVPDFDAFDATPPPAAAAATAAAATESDDPWGFINDPPPPPPPKKTSKKKKAVKGSKNAAVAAAKKIAPEDGEDSSAYPKSITPSPPAEHGPEMHSTSAPAPAPAPAPVATPAPAPAPGPAAQVPPARSRAPLVALVDDDDDTTAVEDADPLPLTKSSARPPAPVPPVLQPPRHATAKPLPRMASPPSRPLSLHGASARDRNNSLTGYRPSAPVPQSSQQRRESFASPRPRFVEPPPPHMPQQHFLALPDLGFNFGSKQEAGRPAGSDGYCCRIDSLADAGDEVSAKKARDALLVGSESCLEVLRILPNKLELVGRLEGLRGSVIDAKILPHVDKLDELHALRPLIAVTVHGPMLDERMDSGPEGRTSDVIESDLPSNYQTSVELYSLQGQCYIATLYRSAPIPIEQSLGRQALSPPDPIGDLHLDAKGQFITVSSGQSGEVFVFTQSSFAGAEETRFRCLGKFWTTVQKPLSSPASRPASAGDMGGNIVDMKEEPRNPVCSLSPRWLAIVPPFTSTNISMQGVPLVSDVNASPPGITTHAAPPQPVVTCEVVGTGVEGAWSRLGRQAAQGLVKYSQRGIEMGLQGWKELTQPSPPGGRQSHERSASKEEMFPPTKGPSEDPTRLAKEPALVSIIDLESLLYWEENKPKYLSPPMATFALLEGCSFLSISSTGTRLLTSSRKGEVSTIWNLMQISHGVPERVSLTAGDESSTSCIRQLQRIARNSPSTVLNCAWSRDGDALALLTAHGTVHLHEVPTRPPSRKRKRANGNAAPAPEKADATVSLSSGMSPPSANQGFIGSIKSGWQTVSTQVNTIRTTNPASAFGLPTTFAGFREATAAAGNAGSRAVARGLSQGYTAAKGGASDYWHADDNKIRHTKALQEPFSAKSLRWVRRNNTTSVVIVCGGSVHVHPVQRVTRRKGDAVVSGLKHERYAHKAFPLPLITTRAEPRTLQSSRPDPCLGQGPHGFWSLRHTSPHGATGRKLNWQASKAPHGQTSDFETNPPYCPFHVDPVVNILAFDELDSGSQFGPTTTTHDQFHTNGHGVLDEDPWTFGEALPPTFKVNDRVPGELHDEFLEEFYDPDRQHADADDDDDDNDTDVASQMESKLTIQPAHKRHGGEQISINTRRRLGRAGGGQGAGKKKGSSHDTATGAGAIAADGDFDLMGVGDDDDHLGNH